MIEPHVMDASQSPASVQAKDKQRQLLEKALQEIKRLKQVAQEATTTLEQRQHEPIAIVGMSCRFPGSDSPEQFWQTLVEGRHCITEMYQQRWNMDALFDPDPDAPGKIYTRALGIIQDPELFDAAFFGIAPREAEDIDPQHRVLLEVCHDALQRAGYSLASINGTPTGVFVGISGQDYAHLGSRLGHPASITPWQGTGNALSAAAGRISYLLNLNGPSLAVDTACSSSLVALHLACQSLRNRESSMALAGGVHLIFNPATTIIFAKARMLSPDGACKTFDADANGYVRSEGCGVVVLKRLSDALRDRDNIVAVIRGSAMNQDGKSQGFTAPSEHAQEAVIRAALAQARLQPADVDYLEAHGTGTPLGDPIELAAANNVYSEGRVQPLWVGACKTNIGHSEAAAGIAGVIKSALAVQHDFMPPHLHFHKPNPYVPWTQMRLQVVTEGRTFSSSTSGSSARRAAVSAFGFTGTNAHVILENPPAQAFAATTASIDEAWPRLLVVAAKSSEALVQSLAALAHAIKSADSSTSTDDLIDLCFTQAVGRDHYRWRTCLPVSSREHLPLALQQAATCVSGEAAPALHAELCVQGAPHDWIAEAARWSVMADQLRRLRDDVQAVATIDIEPLILGETSTADLDGASQALLGVVTEFALAQCWMAIGLRPTRLSGDGMGLLIAATIAGVMHFRDMLQVAYTLLQRRPIAAVLNGMSLHTPRMSVVLPGSIRRIGAELRTADFWCQHLQKEINLGDMEKTSATAATDLAQPSVGADGMLAFQVGPVAKALPFATWRDQQLHYLYINGADLDWDKIWQAFPARRLVLPAHPLARQRFWNDALRDPALANVFPFAAKNWCYELQWQPHTLEPSANREGPWIIVSDDPARACELHAALQCQGEIAFIWPLSSLGQDTKDAKGVLAQILPMAEQAQFIILPRLATERLGDTRLSDEPYRTWSVGILNIAQALSRTSAQLWLLTEGAFPPSSTASFSPLAAVIAGFAKTLALESGAYFNGHLDYVRSERFSWSPIIDCLKKSASVSCLRIQGDNFETQRLERLDTTHVPLIEVAVKPQRYYVVAGGAGTLGAATARWLVEQGATHVALLSRGGKLPESLQNLVRSDLTLTALTVDLCDFASLGACLDALRRERPLAGVIHAAGVFELTAIADMTRQQLFNVMDSKALGICHLDQHCQHDALDMFVGFSSIASVWGSGGNFHYGAANFVVDAVITRRRQRGQCGTVINWGPWQQSGMLTDESDSQARQRGLLAMDKTVGMQVFGRLLRSDRIQTVVADIDWQKLYPLLALSPAASLIAAMAPVKKTQEVALDAEDLQFKAAWQRLDVRQRPTALLTYLRQQLARALHLELQDVDVTQPLINTGMDSLMAVGFRQRIQQVTGLEIPVVLVLGGASLETLADRLATEASTTGASVGTNNLTAPQEDTEAIFEGVL